MISYIFDLAGRMMIQGAQPLGGTSGDGFVSNACPPAKILPESDALSSVLLNIMNGAALVLLQKKIAG